MTTFTRRIHLDAPLSEVWPLLAEPDGWVRWLADDADVEVKPGGAGRLVEDGVARSVEIDVVEPNTRVSFRWWPEDDSDDASKVELTLVPGDSRTTVVITETRSDEAIALARAVRSHNDRPPTLCALRSTPFQPTVALTAGLRLWLATTSLVRA